MMVGVRILLLDINCCGSAATAGTWEMAKNGTDGEMALMMAVVSVLCRAQANGVQKALNL